MLKPLPDLSTITELPAWVHESLHFCQARIDANLERLESFPERTEGMNWICVDNGGWVGGHWVGLLWLAYACTQSSDYAAAARSWASRLADRSLDGTTHDLGFLFELSHVLGFELTGDADLITPALQAAQTLSQRFNDRGGYFQAWGAISASKELRGRVIIDTMMNLDLLFWASRETGNPLYSQQAEVHTQTVIKRQIRSDFSSAHVIDFDPDSGTFIKQDTHQGLDAHSCWSRGQSWAVYGFGDCYRATKLPIYLETACGLAGYAIDHLPNDQVPFWDYRSPDIPNDVRDSSAAAILSAALLNLSALDNTPERKVFWHTKGEAILRSLWENYSSKKSNEPSILIHGTRSKPHQMMDQGLIYGDYYFMEALIRWINLALDQRDDHGV